MVELLVTGELGPRTTELGHTAYRVVQEGLTNAMKHAPDALVAIRVQQGNDAVTIEVVNDSSSEHTSPAAHDRPTPGVSRGLAGLEQRVHELGGHLTAGTRPQGGFAVTAVLPHGTVDAHGNRREDPADGPLLMPAPT